MDIALIRRIGIDTSECAQCRGKVPTEADVDSVVVYNTRRQTSELMTDVLAVTYRTM